jgi:hypothetical protein
MIKLAQAAIDAPAKPVLLLTWFLDPTTGKPGGAGSLKRRLLCATKNSATATAVAAFLGEHGNGSGTETQVAYRLTSIHPYLGEGPGETINDRQVVKANHQEEPRGNELSTEAIAHHLRADRRALLSGGSSALPN